MAEGGSILAVALLITEQQRRAGLSTGGAFAPFILSEPWQRAAASVSPS